MSGATFVDIPSDRMMATIIGLGFHATRKLVGREVVIDLHIPDCMNVVRVFTSIGDGNDNVRSSGVDAVRILVGVFSPYTKQFFPTRASVTLKRTAPLAPKSGDRVGVWLERFEGQVKAALVLAKDKPALPCGRCFNPMVIRVRKRDKKAFLGCCAYPNCSYAMDIPNDY